MKKAVKKAPVGATGRSPLHRRDHTPNPSGPCWRDLNPPLPNKLTKHATRRALKYGNAIITNASSAMKTNGTGIHRQQSDETGQDNKIGC